MSKQKNGGDGACRKIMNFPSEGFIGQANYKFPHMTSH
jgi:hypothetical protein